MAEQEVQTQVQDGGEAAPETKPSGDGKLTDEQLAQVREAVGLKEGQDIPGMITGATKRTVREALGLKDGQDAIAVISGAVTEAIGSVQVSEEKPPAKPKGSEEAEAVRAELQSVKEAVSSLQTEKVETQKQLDEEKRRSAIRAVLGEFQLRDEVKPLVTKAFEMGVEGPRADFNGDGKLVVKDENENDQPFAAYLNGYFKENSGLLAKQKAVGSGARGKAGAVRTTGQITYDRYRENHDEVMDEIADDPEAAAELHETVKEEVNERLRAMGL